MKYKLGELVECSIDNNKWEKVLYLCYSKDIKLYYAITINSPNASIRYFSYCRKFKYKIS